MDDSTAGRVAFRNERRNTLCAFGWRTPPDRGSI